jgi:hypothetical protein
MPIRTFLNKSFDFDPATIQIMNTALAECLITLGLVNKSDDLTRVVADKIIELAQRGEQDPERLKSETLRALRQ